ncbi:MAG: lipoate--protein ligase family protein [Anaerolineales bacterium]|nr:MAG: lipoate--protein ligase family protein [Anaerolineales bacterium]
MTHIWRLLKHGAASAAHNMATDEAILRHVTSGKSPNTLRFYTWDPSAVSIGYFQGIEQEVDLAVCRDHNVAVVRRLTGGGAVYHDRDGEVTYSLSIEDTYPGLPAKVLDSYRVLCAGLIKGFEILGLAAEFKPINDIQVNGKKISGNAQTRRFGGILQHGTLLCRVNPRLMFALLKVPDEKIRDKMIQAVEERVTSVERELGQVDREAITQAMIAGFAEALGIELIAGTLLASEIAMAEQIKTERYANQDWNFKR